MDGRLNEILEQFNNMVEEFNAHAQKCVEKGNKAAGTRSRKVSTAIGKLLKEWRKESVK